MAIQHCRIRKYRKSAQLSQRDLALLLGLRSQGTVADIESGRRKPGLAVALACEIVLGVSVPELFPRLYRGAERRALIGARRLSALLEKSGDRPLVATTVSAMVERIEKAAHAP